MELLDSASKHAPMAGSMERLELTSFLCLSIHEKYMMLSRQTMSVRLSLVLIFGCTLYLTQSTTQHISDPDILPG